LAKTINGNGEKEEEEYIHRYFHDDHLIGS
jgi:hypothetical protein